MLLAVPILMQFGCTSTAPYDVRGTWLVTLSFNTGYQGIFAFTFTGTSEAGVVTYTGIPYPGTYTVSSSTVDFSFEYIEDIMLLAISLKATAAL